MCVITIYAAVDKLVWLVTSLPQLLQQATNLDKSSPLQAINVLCYRAEAEYWSGHEENAIKSMLHAQRLAKGNMAMSAKIDSRLKQMQDDRRMKI